MKKLSTILLGVFVVLSSAAWTNKDQSCSNCETAQSILQKIQSTRSAHLKLQKEHKEHNVQYGPTDERKAFEMAQGEAYLFVCDDDKKTFNEVEKIALTRFVLDLNKLKIDSDSMFEVNSCYRAKVISHRKAYFDAAKKIRRQGELNQFVVMNTPAPLDHKKKK